MAIHMNTNMTSTFSTRVLGENWARSQHSQERLSTGARINRSADDAAGMSISEHNRAGARSLAAAARNLQDAHSLVTTAEGALSHIGDVIVRLRELAVQGASGTISDTERGMIDREVQQLREEIGRVAEDTQYNGVHLLNGTASRLDIQADSANDAKTSRITLNPQEFTVTLERLGLEDISVLTKQAAGQSIGPLDRARVRVIDARTSLGATQHQLEASRENVLNYRQNLAETTSRIRDTDFADETAELVKSDIITHSNAAMLVQASQLPGKALKLLG